MYKRNTQISRSFELNMNDREMTMMCFKTRKTVDTLCDTPTNYQQHQAEEEEDASQKNLIRRFDVNSLSQKQFPGLRDSRLVSAAVGKRKT